MSCSDENSGIDNICNRDDPNLTDILCRMINFWEFDQNLLFLPFLGNEIKINSEIDHSQRKNFLRMVRNIYKFGYNQNMTQQEPSRDPYFYIKIINSVDKTSKTINLQLKCNFIRDTNDIYENDFLLEFDILDVNFSEIGKYIKLGIRQNSGTDILIFDGSLLTKPVVEELQNMGLPIFKFDIDRDFRHQSIYLNKFNSDSSSLKPSSLFDIENAKLEAEKKCLLQFNRFNTTDENCSCIDPINFQKLQNCPNLDNNIEGGGLIYPKYCNYVSNKGSHFQNALNICSTAAAVTYESEIKNIEPENPNMYNDWLRDVKNYDNIANVTNDIYEKVRVSNNDLMTKCPNMKLGLNGNINTNLQDQVINDELVNKVINKYIEHQDELNLEINYDKDNDNLYIENNGEYYINTHPLKNCKKDSYELMKKICQDYSLPQDDDASSFVLPKKCNIIDFKNLLHECNQKNTFEAPGSTEEDIIERILPYSFELEEGKCNAVKMDSMGTDNTLKTWTNMWNEHNSSVEDIGRIIENTISMEQRYFTEKRTLMNIYEKNLDQIEIINQKKNCALLGRQYAGFPAGDGTNCGEKLESNYKNLIVEHSLPVCMYRKNQFKLKYDKYIKYARMSIIFGVLFLIIFLLLKKFIK
jgi:hypothetical protein